jgi:hypothetical protein
MLFWGNKWLLLRESYATNNTLCGRKCPGLNIKAGDKQLPLLLKKLKLADMNKNTNINDSTLSFRLRLITPYNSRLLPDCNAILEVSWLHGSQKDAQNV